MQKRLLLLLSLVFCVPFLVGCGTIFTGKRHADQATEEVLLALEPEHAREAGACYSALHEHLENFGVVNSGVYRSARPDPDQLWRLKNAGFVSVIDFRDSEEDVAKEAAACADLELKYYNLPWNGHDKDIDPMLVSRFLDILNDPAQLPVLVHCKRGAERTGTLLAVYRIEHDGWSAREAYEEMRQYKYRPVWFGNLKRYVFGYEARTRRPSEEPGPGR